MKVSLKLHLMSGIAMLMIGSSANATDQKAACDLDGSQSEMNGCASQRFRQADSKMNDLYKQQMRRLSEKNRARLRESQRAWVIYRDKACFYETGPKSESGSIWPMEDALCREALTKERNEVLKTYVECTAAPCPD